MSPQANCPTPLPTTTSTSKPLVKHTARTPQPHPVLNHNSNNNSSNTNSSPTLSRTTPTVTTPGHNKSSDFDASDLLPKKQASVSSLLSSSSTNSIGGNSSTSAKMSAKINNVFPSNLSHSFNVVGDVNGAKKPISVVSPYGATSKVNGSRLNGSENLGSSGANLLSTLNSERAEETLATQNLVGNNNNKSSIHLPAPIQNQLKEDTSKTAFSSLFNNNNQNTEPTNKISKNIPNDPLPHQNTSSPSNSSSSSSTSSDRNDMSANNANNHNSNNSNHNLNSLDSFITSASIIGGLNPVWSSDNNVVSPTLFNNGHQNNKLIEDDSIIGLSTRNTNYQNNNGNSNNSNNKPIGYERHEKQQIHNNHNVNQFNPNQNNAFNVNMAIGLQLGNLNLDEFSYLYNNLNANNFNSNSNQQHQQQQKSFTPLKPQHQDLNSLFQPNDPTSSTTTTNNNITSPPTTPSAQHNSYNNNNNNTNQSLQNNQSNPFQSMPDFSSLPLPLATQWIANMNNNLMNMNSLNQTTSATNNNNNNLNNRAPFNINQSLSNLLHSQGMGPNTNSSKNVPATSPGVFSFPSVEMMGISQQSFNQANHLNNLQFQSQFLDSLKNNNNWNGNQNVDQYNVGNLNYSQHQNGPGGGGGPQNQQHQQHGQHNQQNYY